MRLDPQTEVAFLTEIFATILRTLPNYTSDEANNIAGILTERVLNISSDVSNREDTTTRLETIGFVNSFKCVQKEKPAGFNIYVSCSVKSGKILDEDGHRKDNFQFYECIVFNQRLKKAIMNWIDLDQNPLQRVPVKLLILNPTCEPYVYESDPRVKLGGVLANISF